MAVAATGPDVGHMRMSAREFKELLDRGEHATILDVRGKTPWETSREKIKGAIRVDPFHFQIDPAWPKDRLTVLYCT